MKDSLYNSGNKAILVRGAGVSVLYYSLGTDEAKLCLKMDISYKALKWKSTANC